MELDGVHHIGINVHDLDRAEAFYTQVLGFKVTERYQEGIRHLMLNSGIHLFEIKGLDMREALATMSEEGYAHIAFGTTRKKFSAIVEELMQKKIDFKGPLIMGKGESVHFTDPDGNPLEIRCPATPEGEATG